MLRSAVAAVLAIVVFVPAGAQDEQRVNEILRHAEIRATGEADAVFSGPGDFPRAIQNLRIRFEVRPWDERVATDLIWMLGNIEDDAEALYYAIRFREENPTDPNRGYPEALLYQEWRQWVKIPRVLEPDIVMDPPPHRNSYSALSAAYMRMGYYADALRVLEIALRHYPEDPAFKRNRDRAAERLRGG